ncbi:MAG: cofactor-independent phosphoglycerate mutase [Planctomycetes bacterium]|nr:cofactor-independent phosphoglycerate mutase [Planctomycetota bacterium]
MKFAIVIPDGCADEPNPALGGRTPLEVARIPNINRLAASGVVGLTQNTPAGFAPASDVANLSVLGYEPERFYTGRAPIEALALGIPLAADDVAMRCNTVTVDQSVMVDFSAGHISSEEGARLIAACNERLATGGLAFFPGVQYRHLMVARGRGALDLHTTPPHDIQGQPVESHLPTGRDAPWARDLMERSQALFTVHPVNVARRAAGKRAATQIWLWGHGRALTLEPLERRLGLRGAMITAVDLLRGLAVGAGMEIVNVPGATGYYDTDYAAKGRAAVALLSRDDLNFVFVHVEAPDEASHDGKVEEKIKAIENIDQHVVGPMLDALRAVPHRVLVLPDHATSVLTRNHIGPPVPFALAGTDVSQRGGSRFTEAAACTGGVLVERGADLIAYLVGRRHF